MGSLKRKSVVVPETLTPLPRKQYLTDSSAGGDYLSCLHDVSYPDGYDHGRSVQPPPSENPAKEFAFTLDPFQAEAIDCLNKSESVMMQASIPLYRMLPEKQDRGRLAYIYISSDGIAKLKGKVACEISTADELTLTELMFNGVLKDVKVEEMVSLLSCLVWQEKLQDAVKPREELEMLFMQLQDTARTVAKVRLECKIQIDVDGYISSFRPDIMEAVYAWAKGSKFYEIMDMTPVFEGSLIRAIRRLEEVLQQLILSAKSIGETDLESKFEEAVSKIKRDIVFAASLYL